MSKTNMPAAEASELISYELAFHVLPTVAEGEVATVFQALKDKITTFGGVVTIEEAPERFDLSYEITKYLEGRNRKFTSAYFGWVRFTADADKIEGLMEEVEGMTELLRHLLVKLTKTEEANPFFFHEAMNEQKVQTVDTDEVVEKVTEKVVEKPEETKDGEASEDKV